MVQAVNGETANSGKNLSKGTELVGGLIDSDKTVSIMLGSENITHKSKNGNSEIHFNPNNQGDKIANEDGSTGRPAFIGLAHEAIHADENAKGTVDHTKINIVNPDGDSPGSVLRGIKEDEVNVRVRENEIRSEHQITGRKIPNKVN